MKLEVGKLYELIEDVEFVSSNFWQINLQGKTAPVFLIKKGAILLFIETRQDPINNREFVFLYKNKKIISDSAPIECYPNKYFKRVL